MLLLMSGAVMCHEGVQMAVLSAGERCVRVLIPSLYLFSILAACFVQSGILEDLSSGRRFLRTDGYLLAVELFSLIGGYPVGAQLLHGMRRQGILTEKQERRMLGVCFGCGPGFLLGTVCGRLPMQAGLWMMFSVSLPNLIVFLILARDEVLPKQMQSNRNAGAALLTGSVESAASAMLKICGMVIGVGAVLGILEQMGVFDLIGRTFPAPLELTVTFLKTVSEVSCITEFMQNGGSLPMAAALLSFGGLCVHLQAAAICEGNLSWIRFWAVRILCSMMAYGICRIGMLFLFRGIQSASLTVAEPVLSGESAVPGVCLLMMSAMLLQRSARRKNR